MYWWQNPIKRLQIRGQAIAKFSSEGCQGRNEFEWIGKVKGFQHNSEFDCDDIIIEIMVHNFSYRDARSNKKPELYTYPLLNADIQLVKGIWILFT